MAFEDRCSPQSAPSPPPGIPHSPQNSTAIVLATTTNGNGNGNSNIDSQQNEENSYGSYAIEQEMSMMVSTAATMKTLECTRTMTTTTNTSPSSLQCIAGIIKQEKHVEQQCNQRENSSQQTSTITTPISFSITNILSNSFGTKTVLNHQNNNNSNNINNQSQLHSKVNRKVVVISEQKKNSILFRPYDDSCGDLESGQRATKRKRFSVRNQQSDDDDDDDGDDEMDVGDNVVDDRNDENEDDEEIDVTNDTAIAIDFSNPKNHQQMLQHYQNAAAAAAVAAQQVLHRNNLLPLDHHQHLHQPQHRPLYPDFYPQPHPQPLVKTSIYPKLHEDILSSTAKQQYQQYYHQTTRLLSDSVLAKYPPLGNLCKTVSQIGQITPPLPIIGGSKIASPTRSEPTSSHKKSVKRSVAGTSSTIENSTTITSSSADASTSISSLSSNSNNNNKDPSSNSKAHQSNSLDSGMESSDDTKSESGSTKDENGSQLWPAWIYCTRYSDRPSSGPRYRKPKTPKTKSDVPDEKRPRTAFSMDQLARLKREFNENRYLTERRRQQLSSELGLNEAQIKIWFQNKRAKIKKSSGTKNPLAMQLMAQGLYNHSTVPLTKEEEELEMRMNGQL